MFFPINGMFSFKFAQLAVNKFLYFLLSKIDSIHDE